MIWKEDEQTCALKSDHIIEIYEQVCLEASPDFMLTYPYSKLKYVICKENGYEIRECPLTNPYFCDKNSSCVKNLSTDCKNSLKRLI